MRTHLSDRWTVAGAMAPRHEAERSRPLRLLRQAQSTAVLTLLSVNDRLIARFAPPMPTLPDTAQWPWIARLEAHTDEIREEFLRYSDAGALPQVAEVAGLEPDSEEARVAVPVRTGRWRAVLLYVHGRWIPETSEMFPVTRSCFSSVHPKSNVGFSVLDPHSHIATHVGDNGGHLRVQLPVIVPGEPGDCRIRIGDEMVHWREGEAIVFDLKTDHEAWNDSDSTRVLLMVEIEQSLPWPLSWLNRTTQYSYRWHPSYRGMTDRIAGYGRRHRSTGA